MFNWLAISALSHPCSSNSTICCSRGPSRTVCSFIPSSLSLSIGPTDTQRGLSISNSHSTHIAILRLLMSVTNEHLFSTGTCEGLFVLQTCSKNRNRNLNCAICSSALREKPPFNRVEAGLKFVALTEVSQNWAVAGLNLTAEKFSNGPKKVL